MNVSKGHSTQLFVLILEQNFFLEPRAAQHSYAFKISRLESTRSIRGRMPRSLEMARDSSSKDMAFSRSPGSSRWSRVSA